MIIEIQNVKTSRTDRSCAQKVICGLLEKDNGLKICDLSINLNKFFKKKKSQLNPKKGITKIRVEINQIEKAYNRKNQQCQKFVT